MSSHQSAQWPAHDDCLPVNRVVAPHPAVWSTDDLSELIRWRTQTRSGPGGQHRNRTASGAFATIDLVSLDQHRLSFTTEATESRHQRQNRDRALHRLRLQLALAVRTKSRLPDDQLIDPQEQDVVSQSRQTTWRFAESNAFLPAMLAVLLNDLHASGGQPSLVAPAWHVSTSRLIGCIKRVPPAWAWLQKVRTHHGRLPLRS
ncbi:MAG: peptide chain release factor-like protein [Planctomycetota bacterium]